MRKLNMAFAADMAKSGGAAFGAYLYEEIAGSAVVDATAQDGKLSPFDFVLQVAVGWLPFVAASHLGGHFAASFAGAVAFNRIDNLAISLGAKAATRFGDIRRGETLAQAQSRLGVG